MSRSMRKGPYVEHSLYKKVLKKVDLLKQGRRVEITTWSRRSTIIPAMVNMTMKVHNGRSHIAVLIVENMVGQKLGSFAPTRTFKGHNK